jgi:carbonic anhydrase/acetyltransferase-like protein (isoleucine patch superfamily)
MIKHRSGTVAFGKPLFHLISTVYLTFIYGLPLLLIVWSFVSFIGSPWRWAVLILAPWSCTVSMILISGLCSLPHQRSITPGTFPRDLNSRIYFHRRLYGTCWTAMYYCNPVYSLCLSVPPLKWLLFRIFGYRGTLEFTIYPDTWIRDLPLLKFGRGAYLSNRATIGTNIALANGHILVDEIIIGEKSCIGHLAMLAPGVETGYATEIGVGCAIGIRTKIGESSRIGPTCAIDHGVQIGSKVIMGGMSCVGKLARIGNGISIAVGSLIPNSAVLSSQEDANHVTSSRTSARSVNLIAVQDLAPLARPSDCIK